MADNLPDRDYDFDEIMETYRQDGSLLRAKARIVVEEKFIEEAYRRLCDTELPTSALVDITKLLVEIGDLKPKQSNTPAQTGPIASIQIVFPAALGVPPQVVDVTPVSSEPDDTQTTHSIEEAAEPVAPVDFNTPAMDFTFEAPASIPALPSPPDDNGD